MDRGCISAVGAGYSPHPPTQSLMLFACSRTTLTRGKASRNDRCRNLYLFGRTISLGSVRAGTLRVAQIFVLSRCTHSASLHLQAIAGDIGSGHGLPSLHPLFAPVANLPRHQRRGTLLTPRLMIDLASRTPP